MQFNVSCFLAIAFRTQRSTIDAEVIRTTSPSAVAPVLSGSVLRFSSPVRRADPTPLNLNRPPPTWPEFAE
jgi:hypothetical protein